MEKKTKTLNINPVWIFHWGIYVPFQGLLQTLELYVQGALSWELQFIYRVIYIYENIITILFTYGYLKNSQLLTTKTVKQITKNYFIHMLSNKYYVVINIKKKNKKKEEKQNIW